MTDEVEDVVALAQAVDEAVEGEGLTPGRVAGEGGDRDGAQGLSGAIQLALDVDGGQGLAAAGWGVGVQIGGVGDGDQCPQVAPGAELHLLPTDASQQAGEEQVLLDDQPGAVLGVAQGLPAQLVQVGGAAIDEQAETQGALAGTRISLGTQPVLIGRADDSTLVLTDDYASTRHARLSPRGSDWYVEDLGATNGTYLDRAKVTTAVRVPLGPPVRVGKTVIELRP